MDLNFLKPNKKNVIFTILVYVVIFFGMEIFSAKLAVIPQKCSEGMVHGFSWVSSNCFVVWEAYLFQIILPLIIIYILVSLVIRK